MINHWPKWATIFWQVDGKKILWWVVLRNKIYKRRKKWFIFFKGASQIYQASWVRTNFVWNLVFISSYKNHMNSMLWLIWLILVCIQYFKQSNICDFFLNDMHEYSCLIYKSRVVLCKITLWWLHEFNQNVNHMYVSHQNIISK
jgi:hypothetical protein